MEPLTGLVALFAFRSLILILDEFLISAIAFGVTSTVRAVTALFKNKESEIGQQPLFIRPA